MILQRQNAVTGDEWHRIGFGSVQAGGSYTITHIRSACPATRAFACSCAATVSTFRAHRTSLEYEISQAQNPSLTIASSADPITYGQSATISGVLAGGATPQPVTLEARTVHQHGFAPGRRGSTGAGGSYSFPAQRR